jgi:hypothetical protein
MVDGSFPHQLSLPGIPAALVCRDDIDPGNYVETSSGTDDDNFGQYVTYNKDKRFVCAEGKRYFKLLDGDKHGRGSMMIIVANYKQGLPIEVSCYDPYRTDDGSGGDDGELIDIKDIKDDEAVVDRVFHQLYDDQGYPKALSIKYRCYDFDSNKPYMVYALRELRDGDGTVIESWNFDKTKFFGIHSKYINNKIQEWAMLDGNNKDYFDGLRIVNVTYFNTTKFDNNYGKATTQQYRDYLERIKVDNIKVDNIKVTYHNKGKEVTPQQYVDYIKNLSFTGVLGDSKQPQISSLILQYSNLSHIKDNLIQAKKVLAPYNTQPNVIEALQVIDAVIGLLS